jgi:hypothetical protein
MAMGPSAGFADGDPGPINLQELNRDVRPRILAMAEAVFAEQKARDEIKAREIGPKVDTGRAEAEHAWARLVLEVADLALKEYNESTAKQERSRIEAEIRIAEAAVRGAEEDLGEAEEIARTSRATNPASVLEVTKAFDAEGLLEISRLELKKRKLELEVARNSLIVFDGYDKIKQVAELRSAIESARYVEKASNQVLEMQRSEAERRKRAVNRLSEARESRWTEAVKAMGDVVKLEAELRPRLEQQPADETSKRAIAELSSRLRGAMEFVERVHDEVALNTLREAVASAAPRARSASPLLQRLRSLSPEDRKNLLTGTPEQRDAIYKKAGFTEPEIKELKAMMDSFQKR